MAARPDSPALSNPRLKPPQPQKRSMNVGFFISASFYMCREDIDTHVIKQLGHASFYDISVGLHPLS
jgi:hypothetical protein